MNRRHDHLRLVAVSLAVLVLVGLALGVRDLNAGNDETRRLVDDTAAQIDQVQDFLRASRESRLAFQARETFLLCSRDADTIRPDRRDEVAEACEGYETFDAAIATERTAQGG